MVTRSVAARALGLLGALGAACSGKPRPEDAAHGVPAPAGDAGAGSGSAGGSAGSAQGHAATGDLQIRVEWPNVPVVARSSPGRTPCNTPRAPSIAPTTTWGVPDALVIIAGADAAQVTPAFPPAAHVTLADCALAPRLVVGGALAITSAVDHPARLVLRKLALAADLASKSSPAPAPVPVMLPIAGHTVTSALDPGAIYAVATDDAEPELAFVAAVPGAYVTEPSGQLTVHGLAPGPHAVTVWLPPRAGQPARLGRGTARLVAGELAELTVALAPLP